MSAPPTGAASAFFALLLDRDGDNMSILHTTGDRLDLRSGDRAIARPDVLPKPDWLKVRLPGGAAYTRVKSALRTRCLHTVCEEAMCPNMGECWGGGTATFMVLGDTCTRGCRFCAVRAGNPRGIVDPEEPDKLAEAVADLDLTYVVLTMVTRDDLPDGGGDHLARCVERIKARRPSVAVEVLTSDFLGDNGAVERIAASGAEVLAHNLETVESLTPRIRDARASYPRSLQVLARFKALAPSRHTKSGLFLGLGETEEDVRRACADLRAAHVDILTLGQYLRPSLRHVPVAEYLPPQRFAEYQALAESFGFLFVASGPLVRSSYRAGEFFMRKILDRARSAAPAATGELHGQVGPK
jgi:lipoic acid synthetase